MTIKQILDEVAQESSTNAKLEIVKKYKPNTLFQRVLYLAKSKRVKFYIKQIPDYSHLTNKETRELYPETLDVAVIKLTQLSERILTGNAAIEFLASLLASLSEDDAYVIERIIQKDLKIGFGTTQINKVFPDLIEKEGYMGAQSFSEKKAKALFEGGKSVSSQIKMDGRYCNAIIQGGEVSLASRQGEDTILPNALFVKQLGLFGDCVLNGELTMAYVDRYKSNGIISSLVTIGSKTQDGKSVKKELAAFQKEYNMSIEDALNKIQYTIWDQLTINEYFNKASNIPYQTRLDGVIDELHGIADHSLVNIVERKTVSTYKDAMDHFQEALSNGEEGTIIKSLDGLWEDGKPAWQCKLKLEMTVDLKIVGTHFGNKGTKNENTISRLQCESSDGKVISRPGGMNEKLMDYFLENREEVIGKIVEVKCCGLTFSDGKYSLLHPRVMKLRDDKVEADSLESIQQNENMTKGLA